MINVASPAGERWGLLRAEEVTQCGEGAWGACTFYSTLLLNCAKKKGNL